MRKYYSLMVQWDKGGRWTVEFGDYVRKVVADERQYYMDFYGLPKRRIKVIESGDTNNEIFAAVNKLNGVK